MSWRDPAEYTFVFESGDSLSLPILGVFDRETELSSLMTKLGVQDLLQAFSSSTQDDFMEMREMAGESWTEEELQEYPKTQPFHPCGEALKSVRALQKEILMWQAEMTKTWAKMEEIMGEKRESYHDQDFFLQRPHTL